MREAISIWWFAGVLLLIYGVLIFATGLWELAHPLPHPPVLHQLQAPIWWGALLAVSGLWYVIHFRPRKHAAPTHEGQTHPKD
jgi:hypothetical protein